MILRNNVSSLLALERDLSSDIHNLINLYVTEENEIEDEYLEKVQRLMIHKINNEFRFQKKRGE